MNHIKNSNTRLPEPTEQQNELKDLASSPPNEEGIVEEFLIEPLPSVTVVTESVSQNEPSEIHYFHGAIGGYYRVNSPLEVGMLVVIGAFSILTVVILLIQFYRLFRAIIKDKRTYN